MECLRVPLLWVSEPGINGNEGTLRTPQTTRTGALPSDVVLCRTGDVRTFLGGLISLPARGTISLF